MKHNLLYVLTAILLAVLACGCSDDTDMVDAASMNLEYRHIDFEKLPQPVQDAIKKFDKNVDNLWYIIKGQFKGHEAYMYDFWYSSSSIGRTISADGTEFLFEEVEAALEAGQLKNWICIYHFSYDWQPTTPNPQD